MMTPAQRRKLAGAVATAAADMLGRDYADEYEEASHIVAGWLARALPGDEWDRRLPDPKPRPRPVKGHPGMTLMPRPEHRSL